MSPNEYQTEALATALPNARNLNYMLIGLCNEAGEVAGKFKKVLRGDAELSDARHAIADELGDVAWYLAGAASMCGYDLNRILHANIEKLLDRKARGVLQGNGDTR